MAYRYLIYSTGTTYSGTILKDNGGVVPSPSANTASYYTNFAIPEIQPLYLWQVDNVVVPTTLIANTDTKISNYQTATAPAPQPSDAVTLGQVTGLTNTKISKFVGTTGHIPLISSSGQALSDSGYNIAQLITAGSGVTNATFAKYTGTTAPATYQTIAKAITGATNLGSGNGTIYTNVSGNKINLKTLSGGTNVTLTCNGNYIGINATDTGILWTGSTANGVGTYASSGKICSNPNMTFNGSALSVTGNINASTYICAPTITGSTKICSPIIAGTSCVTAPVVLASSYVCSPVITGSTKICSPITIGTSCVCGPIILGSTCVCSPTLCASTSAFAPTAAINNNSTCVATTAWHFNQSGNTTPLMDGTAAIGSSLRWAHNDHVHPSDTSRVTRLTGATQNDIVIFGVAGAMSDSGKIFTTTVNPAGSATNSCVPTELAVRNAINSAVVAAIILQGDWNATTNSPSLTGPLSAYTTGFAWRVGVSGTTSLSGINYWRVGDLAIKGATSWIRTESQDIAAVWGNISGTLSNQTDLQNALNAKANAAFLSTYTGTTVPNTYATKSFLSTYTGTTAPNTFASKGSAVTGATNLGSGNGTIYTNVSGNKINLKTLSGGTNITITCNGNYIAINGSVSSFNWSGSTANGVGTYVSATCIKDNPNMTFDGTSLSVTGNIKSSVYVCSPVITGSTRVCSPIVCGTSCITSPIACGSTCVISPITIGSTCVCGPVILGSTYVCSPVITGSTKVCSPIVYGTSCITSPVACGTSCVVTPILLASTYVCSPIITGSTRVCSPIVCGTSCVTSPVTIGSTCVCGPVILGSTCVCSPLHCGACGYFSTAVCSPIITGSTKVCSPIIAATSCVTAPTVCGTSSVLTPIVCASSCVRSPLLSGGTLSILTSATAPTPAANNNSTCVATTAWYFGQSGNTNPVMDGTATIGTSPRWAHQDHVHPSDTSKLNVSVFTGYTASTKNKDKKIQLVSTGTGNVNVVTPTGVTFNLVPYSADTYLWKSTTANTVFIKSAGDYQVDYHVILKNDTSNQTHSVGGYIVKNGSTLQNTATAAMIVGVSASGELSLPPVVQTFANNDRLVLTLFRIGSVGTVNLVANSTILTLNKLT